MGDTYNEIRNNPGLVIGISRAMGMDFDQEGASRLGETITPILDILQGPEFAYLRGERLASGRNLDAAVAAQYSAIGLRNPTGSGRLFVVEAIIAHGAQNETFQIHRRANAAVDSTTEGYARDSRWGLQLSIGQLTTVTAVAGPGASMGDIRCRGYGDELWKGGSIVLLPGNEIFLVHASVNSAVEGTFSWRERQIVPGEDRSILP